MRNNSNIVYHPVGACAMLPKHDGGVVDSKLLVYGTSNLRVVDASVIPILVSTHPQTGIYGIAEREPEIISECVALKIYYRGLPSNNLEFVNYPDIIQFDCG